jgi:sigma-B regulation protein RsbU (phosphoserine phosphatase)
MPLGVVAGSTYRPVETRLEPGDVLVLYSDGVTEAARAKDGPGEAPGSSESSKPDESGPKGDGGRAGDDEPPRESEFFDEHRLEAAVREVREKSAAEIIGHIMDSIRAFTAGAEQSDDLTLVVVRLTG